ncbi:hypothetical protein C8J57DRAFT_1317099 [Mycena rebaudengoi]|nr:hypothetical protein C8J57DRAFT_1317099 [Mycena rebaudengoi]
MDSEHTATDPHGSFQAAVARTATRAVALYFSRPVRLFRPSKVSGWHSLRGLAAQDGASLTPTYMKSLVKNQGFMVLTRHFFPPMVVNAVLGTVLWASYAEASSALHPHIGSHPTLAAALSGAVAGAAQAIVSAPAENVRILIEGGTSGHSWSHAWKEVFRGTPSTASASRHDTIEEIRQVRSWMKEVGEMGGRAWSGFGWTLGKDVTGFSAFFAIFEITRRIALKLKTAAQERLSEYQGRRATTLRRQVPPIVHGVSLVTGGVVAGLSYELIGRPWEVARRAVHLERMTHLARERRSPLVLVAQKIQQEGLSCLLRDPNYMGTTASSASSGRMYSVLRTLARVGPWGIGFLVWEAYGSGLG